MPVRNGNFCTILFDGEKMIDPLTEVKDDSWIMVSYGLNDDGKIISIMVNDFLSGRSFM